ncbi:MAG TPA: transketolase, partial [Leptospiraceae bacterium]|nr:transketolase [Leptospiraceae bacterium]
IQIDGFTEDIMKLEPLGRKFEMFGWNLIEADGHDMKAILDAFEQAKAKTEGPTLIVFRTVLGKGVSFMENKPEWHGTPPNAEQMEKALQEIGV